jgi:putative DNA primase/helicase
MERTGLEQIWSASRSNEASPHFHAYKIPFPGISDLRSALCRASFVSAPDEVYVSFTDLLITLGAKPTGSGFKACCPAHPDSNPSLSITERNGKWLFHCFAGCKQEEVIAALRQLGLWPCSMGRDRETFRRIASVHDYTDENRKLLFQQVRFDPKAFRPRRPDPDNPGRYLWSVTSEHGTYAVRLVPYRLPELLARDTTFIVEGEKDADTLHKHGFCATTNAFGAENWSDEFNPYFEGKQVFIIPDNDKAGWKRAIRIAAGVAGLASQLSILALPRETKDTTDWFEQGHSAAELTEIIQRRSGDD